MLIHLLGLKGLIKGGPLKSRQFLLCEHQSFQFLGIVPWKISKHVCSMRVLPSSAKLLRAKTPTF